MEKVIDVQRLFASIGGNQILSDVSFSAFKGEITVIIGGSGSGKTTILRHLLGIYPVVRGYISVLDNDISKLTEKQLNSLYRNMGVFYQEGALLNSMTVGENVALPLNMLTSLPKMLIEDIVYMKLGLVNLEEAFHLYPSQLSGGMLKRAALARAIALDPPLLFCDEPGAGLDPASMESLDKLIINLRNQLGISVVMITHEVSSILRIADRIVFLDSGSVIFEGSLKGALSSGIGAINDFFSILKSKHAGPLQDR